MMERERLTKTDKVRLHLESGRAITPMLALVMYGSFSLGDIISNLRRRGYLIQTDIVSYGPTGSKFAKYSLVKTPNQYESGAGEN